MAGMAGKGWRLKIAGSGRKWLGMAGNRWKQLLIDRMDGSDKNQLGMAGMAKNDWKWLEMAKSG